VRKNPILESAEELCVFSQIMWDLKSGDAAVEGSHEYADYRDELVSEDEAAVLSAAYQDQAGIPTDAKEFVAERRRWLGRIAQETDGSFPENDAIRIENGEPTLAKVPRQKTPARLAWFEATIRKEMPQTPILDALADTENLLHWTRFFGPLSGLDAKLENPAERYVLASFCYGCNLGPSQTARSVQGTDRRQIAWINQRHITEDALDEAITAVINAYNNFSLPRLWGSGKHASADGTRWDLYEQNLLSEYHIRYGGYGGIGYYHVSDTYIALFSHFIPCGVWEAVYILDGLLKNESDIQPDVLHADTQGQSEPVFALAHLLGIELMPRIRNWKSLDFCRPDPKVRYDHIDSLFTEYVDWSLIETYLPDMLRVVLSIKAGRISASTILRRLGTYSRKNRLYQAFCELGRVIRTGFLLRYISDAQLRSTIQGATNKSEALNRFLKWTFFGGEGVITENSRDEQKKTIKYNHLVANCLIFHNLCSLTRLVQHLEQRGETVSEDAIAAISPYLTEHINRFGDYTLNLGRKPPQPDYGYTSDGPHQSLETKWPILYRIVAIPRVTCNNSTRWDTVGVTLVAGVKSDGQVQLPQQRILFLVVRLHAPQNIAQDAHGREYIGPFVQHDTFRALTHRCIGDLSARWNAIFRERFEHLGRPDHWHMGCLANPEDFFLHLGKSLIAALDCQIAARNHYPGGTAPHRGQKQLRQMVKSLMSFDLQNNPNLFAVELSQMRLQLKYVAFRADERVADNVGILDHKWKGFQVLMGKRA
jgi:TnpA family transposase